MSVPGVAARAQPADAAPYVLGDGATAVLTSLGVPADRLAGDVPSRRPLLRFCLDWSEQRHHLGGRLGADLLTAFADAGWVTRAPQHRAVRLTPAGEGELRSRLGLDGTTRSSLSGSATP
jgi:hypothetical protein